MAWGKAKMTNNVLSKYFLGKTFLTDLDNNLQLVPEKGKLELAPIGLYVRLEKHKGK